MTSVSIPVYNKKNHTVRVEFSFDKTQKDVATLQDETQSKFSLISFLFIYVSYRLLRFLVLGLTKPIHLGRFEVFQEWYFGLLGSPSPL